MQMIKVTVLIIIAILLIISGYLGYLNRSSEKIITSLLTIAFIGVSSTLISTLFIMKGESKSARYVKSYVFEKISKAPIWSIEKPASYIFAGENRLYVPFYVTYAIEKKPELIVIKENLQEEIDEGVNLYFEIFVSQIFQTLMRCNWRADIKREDGLTWGRVSYGKTPKDIPSSSYSIEYLNKLFPEIYLLNDDSFPRNEKFTTPPKTKITRLDDSIMITNKFVIIKISFKKLGGMNNAGPVRLFMGFDTFESLKFYIKDYEVRVDADFDPIRTGHPEMKFHHEWVDTIISEFEINFDSNKHLKEAKESYYYRSEFTVDSTEEFQKQWIRYTEWHENERKVQ